MPPLLDSLAQASLGLFRDDSFALGLHGILDIFAAFTYAFSSLAIVYLLRRRKGVQADRAFACFTISLVVCGFSHAAEIWSLRHPTYGFYEGIHTIAVLSSILTAALTVRLVPQLVTDATRGDEAEKRLAAELNRERQQLDDILNSVPAMVFEFLHPERGAERPNFVSNYIQRVLGYTPEEWNSTPDFWFSRVHPDDQARIRADSVEVFAGRRPETVVSRWLAKDGHVVQGETHLVHIHNEIGEIIGLRGFMLDVTERMQTEAEMERLNKQLVDVSRQAGMAEVATSVLHNVGNVLNSVNVSCSVISTAVRKSRLGNVAKTAGLLRDNATDLATFFSHDPVGQKLPDFLGKLAEKLTEEQASVLQELQLLGQNIEHIKDIVAMQQSYARVSGVAEIVNVVDLVEDSLRMNAGALTRHEVQPIREYHEVPSITVEKHKVLQILVNLIRNAKYACDESGRTDKQMCIRVAESEGGVQIAVVDNGVGISPENMIRIFNHGFTTRKDGHGFGLHSAVLAAEEMGGRLTAQSDGAGTGATFLLDLPITPPSRGASRVAADLSLAH